MMRFAGLAPILVALIVAGLQIIERAQVDWAANCSVAGICDSVQQGDFLAELLGWLPALFTFAILHAALRRYPREIEPSRPDRAVRVVVFALVSIFPTIGWYLALAGIAAGFLAAITVIGLVVAPLAGVLGGAWFGGLVLGVAAGPSFGAGWAIWKQVLLRYANSTALAGLVLAGGVVLFDPQFAALGDLPHGLRGLALLMIAAIAFLFVHLATMDPTAPIGPNLAPQRLVAAGGPVGLAVVGIAAMAALAIGAGVKPLSPIQGLAPDAVALIRGYKPPDTVPLQLAGLDYVGDRRAITQRSSERRDNLPEGRALSWRMTSPIPGLEDFHLVADQGGAVKELLCMEPSAGKRLCFRDSYVARDRTTTPLQRAMTFESEDAFEDVSDLPHAYLGIRFDRALKLNGTALADGPRRLCRLGLVNITAARLSLHQILPCDRPWQEDARRLRDHVESLFRSATHS